SPTRRRACAPSCRSARRSGADDNQNKEQRTENKTADHIALCSLFFVRRSLMELQGHTFLVTGGGSGLGAATARMFVAAGANMLIADVNRAAGETMVAELGAQARFAPTDVADEASAQAAVRAAVEAFGGLHGVVNCAGIAIAERTLGKGGA